MRKFPPHHLEISRVPGIQGNSPLLGMTGVFQPLGPCGVYLRIVASDASFETQRYPWEHVSVSLPNRCPNWTEMCFVKDLFWDENEVVMQLHPAKKDYINNHPYCLHMWRPVIAQIPLPPIEMVGVKL